MDKAFITVLNEQIKNAANNSGSGLTRADMFDLRIKLNILGELDRIANALEVISSNSGALQTQTQEEEDYQQHQEQMRFFNEKKQPTTIRKKPIRMSVNKKPQQSIIKEKGDITEEVTGELSDIDFKIEG